MVSFSTTPDPSCTGETGVLVTPAAEGSSDGMMEACSSKVCGEIVMDVKSRVQHRTLR
jgi:hypothetical protein